MFRFESPIYLYLLTLIPLLFLLFALNLRKRRNLLGKLGNWKSVCSLLSNVSEKRVWFKFILLVSALFFLILSLARPQIGTRQKTDTVKGIEVVVALDVSNSMMAQDVKPTRLDKAKQIVSSVCNRLRNDKMALVVFAGNAFLQVPISADNVSITMFLDAVNTGMIPTQGTSINEALSVGNRSFSAQKGVKKALVMITDGEDHEGGIDDAIKELKKNDIKVFVMGIGEPKGAPVIVGGNYLRSMDGQIVISRLNEQMCKDVANRTDGTYIHVDNTNSAQEQLVNELKKLQASEMETTTYSEYNELFPWLAAISLVLLMMEVVVQYRKSRYSEKWERFWEHGNASKLVVFFVMCVTCMPTPAQTVTKIHTHKGNVSFNRKHDSLAIINYKKAIAADQANFKAHYNLGNTYLRQGKGQDAMKEYEKSASYTSSKLMKKTINHNMGCIYYFTKQYDKPVEAFKESLRADPKDNRVRYNLAMAQFMLKKNPGKSSPQPDPQQNKQDKQKNNQDNQNQGKTDAPNQKKPTDGSMSKQNAEQMLRAVQMKERKTQEKLKHKQKPNSRKYLEKNW